MQNRKQAQKNAERFATMEPEQCYQAALEMAGQLLSYRAMSAQMLREKMLGKGMQEESADYAIAYLTERGLLSDTAYAESVVRSYTRRGYGAMRVKQELHRRGVSGEEIAQALEEHEPDWEAMQKLLDKRLRGDMSDRKEVDKAVAALARRGFGWSEIRQALELYRQADA